MSETIVLTGISGFVAKHIALKLLVAGYSVRGTLRRLDRAEEVRTALRPHLPDDALPRLTFAAADLESDAGWPEAMAGATALLHTASPFPIAQPKDPQALIRPAVEGTERVLNAASAAGVTRVVLTSSTVAVLNDGKHSLQDESDWCDLTDPHTTAYAASKTMAEKKAWEIAKAKGLALTAINPAFVMGPPLDGNYGASLGLVERLLKGRDPMVPPYGFPIVDVRDVAEMHLRALKRPETAGKRFIAASGSLALADMGRILKSEYPTRRIPTREAPALLMRIMALWDGQVRSIVPKLGHLERVSNLRAVQELGMEFISPQAALKASADWLVRNGKIWA